MEFYAIVRNKYLIYMYKIQWKDIIRKSKQGENP